MVIAIIFVLVAAGVTLFLTPYFFISFLCFGGAALLWKYYTVKGEEAFIAVLAVLAFLGVICIIVEDLVGRFILS